MFVVLVKSRFKLDKIEIYENTFRSLRETVLANEPGVTFYELARVPGEPGNYRLVECYTDTQVQQEHLEKDYYQAAIPIIVDCLEGATYEMEVVETI